MLYTIDKSNKAIAIRIMQKALSSSPNLRWMTGNKRLRLQNLYRFCLQIAMLYKGAYLNPDMKGVVFFYKRGKQNTWAHKIKSLRLYIIFLLSAVNLSNIFKIYKFQQLIKKYRPKIPHLYCLVLAVDPNDKSTQTVIKLRDYLFEQSQKEQLPIYIQTSLRRNKILFERYGFECYQKLENENYSLWLLKRNYEK